MPDSVSPETLRRMAEDVLRLPARQIDFAALAPLVRALLGEMREMEPLLELGTEPYRPVPRERWER